jgi:hypothetical protein
MYGTWRMKRAVLLATMMAWERYAVRVPVVRYPQGQKKRKKEAEEIGRNWRSNERSWFVLEGAATEGWDIDAKGGNEYLPDPTPLVRLYNDEMATAAIQHAMNLGRTQSGSRALAAIQIDPFYLAAQAIAKDVIAAQKMRVLFRQFVDVNFGTQVDVPTLSVSKIQGKNIDQVSQAMALAADAGLNFTDPEVEDAWRDIADLPRRVRAAAGLPEDVGLGPTPPQRPLPAGREGDGLAPVTPIGATAQA